jgi:hypothetical protein
MRALVVFESMFGNTQTVAEAIAHGLSPRVDVDVVEVGEAPPAVPDDIDLLIVGGPTHAFGMSRLRTRKDAASKGAVVSKRIGMREWIDGLPSGRSRIVATTFDTKVKKPRTPGSAARGAERRLRQHGFRMLAPAATFYVDDVKGPLLEGETQRAREWGEDLAAHLGAALTN